MDEKEDAALLAEMTAALNRDITSIERGKALLATADHELLRHAARVFDNSEGAAQWLVTPQLGLQGRIPLDVAADNAGGFAEVKMLLGMIDRGGFG